MYKSKKLQHTSILHVFFISNTFTSKTRLNFRKIKEKAKQHFQVTKRILRKQNVFALLRLKLNNPIHF